MEKLIVFGGRLVALLEEQFEKATGETFHDAETLCSENGISIERQVWAFLFVAMHLAMYRAAVSVYQTAQPYAAQKLQELTGRVQTSEDSAAVAASSVDDANTDYSDEDASILLSVAGIGDELTDTSISQQANGAALFDESARLLDCSAPTPEADKLDATREMLKARLNGCSGGQGFIPSR